MKIPKPEPVVTSQVCSVCGEDWAKHPENPTVLDCIAILRARPATTIVYPQWSWTVTSPRPWANTVSPTTWPAGTVWSGSSTANVIALNRGDDDPDMGVPAEVG